MMTEVTEASSKPVSPEVAEMARCAVKDFHECFWFRHPDADITEREDIDIIIHHLRHYGGHRAWKRSQELRACL
jgi:hypothetical protein